MIDKPTIAELEAEVARLTAALAGAADTLSQTYDALYASQARIVELEAALRPFAEADDPNRLSDADLDVVARVLFEYRYYRRAREALERATMP